MPPQQYQQPVLPPQGPIFRNPYLPSDQGVPPPPPRSHKKRWIFILLLLVLVGAGAAYYFLVYDKSATPKDNDPAKATSEPDETLTGLRVGPYYYVSACNAFTADDFTDATGRTTDDSSITTQFATKTYADNKESAVFSTCSRLETAAADDAEALSIGVSMYQYTKTADMADRLQLLGLDKAAKDDGLGGPALFDEQTLTMQVGNKVVTVLLQGYGDMGSDDIKDMVYAAAGDISGHLRAKDQQALSELEYPAKVTAPAFTYHNACSLWGAADFAKLYGKADETNISMRYATAITEGQQTASLDKSTKATCVIGSYTADSAALTSKDYAYVEVDYYPTAELASAGYDSHTSGEEGTVVPDIGDKASYSDDRLTVLGGSTLIRMQFKPHTGKPADQTKVASMAQTALSRLQ